MAANISAGVTTSAAAGAVICLLRSSAVGRSSTHTVELSLESRCWMLFRQWTARFGEFLGPTLSIGIVNQARKLPSPSRHNRGRRSWHFFPGKNILTEKDGRSDHRWSGGCYNSNVSENARDFFREKWLTEGNRERSHNFFLRKS